MMLSKSFRFIPQRRGVWLFAGVAGWALLASVTPAARQDTTAVTILAGGNLLDGTGAPVRANVDITIEGSRITRIAPGGSQPSPRGATVIDAHGRWILPGLIDSHVHYQSWMGELFLRFGVTTVFDLGNEMNILQQREAIRAGRVHGPRLFVTGQGLEGPLPPNSGPPGNPALRSTIHSAEEARAKAAQMLDLGVDAIKIREFVPASWIRGVVEVAHARNKPVLGHLNTPAGEAIDAGLDALIHPYGIDLSTLSDPTALQIVREAQPLFYQRQAYYPSYVMDPKQFPGFITTMVRKSVYFNPTFGAQFRGIYPERDELDAYDSMFMDASSQELGYFTEPIKQKLLPYFGRSRGPEIDAALRQRIEAGMELVAEFVRQFERAGGKLLSGTDTSEGSGGIPGVRLHRELQLWTSRGISPMQAIRASTQHPAQLFRLADIGTLEVGKQADILVLRGDPLADIRMLGNIERVLLAGKPVARTLDPATFAALVRKR
jgi:hypothetical protein